jgi:hypothetical protein
LRADVVGSGLALCGAVEVTMRALLRYGWLVLALSTAAVGCGGQIADDVPGDDDTGAEATAGLNESGRNGQRIEIPLVVVLWENANFGGRKRVFVDNQGTLANGTTDRTWQCSGSGDQQFCAMDCTSGPDFNDMASAVGVHPGPDYQSFINRTGRQPTVTLFADAGFSGRSIKLAAGTYNDLSSLGFNDTASSLAIDYTQALGPATILPTGTATPFPSIPYVVRLHSASYDRKQACQEADTVITLVESSADLAGDYGFNDVTSWVEVLGGTAGFGSSVKLFTDPGFGGSFISTSTIGDWKVADSGFGDLTSSVKITGPIRVIINR